jgi:hypothetical protein
LHHVQGHLDTLNEAFGGKVIAGLLGTTCARLAIRHPVTLRTADHAQTYAEMLARFIQTAHPILCDAFATVPSRRGRRPTSNVGPLAVPDGSAHQILDNQIDHIRRYLSGRADRPSDEVLCDWVQLCYTFELHREAVEVFDLIDPSAVHGWPCARAKRLAEVCRVNARR